MSRIARDSKSLANRTVRFETNILKSENSKALTAIRTAFGPAI